MLLNGNIPFGYLFNQIRKDLVVVLIISGVLHSLKLFYVEHLPAIPLPVVSVLGTGISLLLAFKLSQSYDRWWEARKVWGSIVNDSRTLVLQLLGFISIANLKNPEIQELVTQIAYRQIGWCYMLGQALRRKDPIENVELLVAPEELEALRRHSNKPLYLLTQHLNDVKKLHEGNALNDFQQIRLEDTISRLCDAMGKSERIANTIFPVTYRKFLHLFIYLFLILLSIALVETIGIVEIPLLVLIAATFFLIEKSAKHLQDPFSNRPTDTPITAIARTIEINIRQLLDDKAVPPPVAPKAFYVM